MWGTAQLFMHPRYMHGAATRYFPTDSVLNMAIMFVSDKGVIPLVSYFTARNWEYMHMVQLK